MSYRWVDHTSEVELEIEAAGEHEVLEAAVRALAELHGIDTTGPTTDRPLTAHATDRRLTAHAADRPALLAAWMEELVFLAESEGFVATEVLDLQLGAGSVSARVAGVLDEPPPLVKAVTYHRLTFEPAGEVYVARVILDV
ncbi:MAG: archease [Solirubrobacterales bacterium]|nr:archease [Solirubrobacterales bacterium]